MLQNQRTQEPVHHLSVADLCSRALFMHRILPECYFLQCLSVCDHNVPIFCKFIEDASTGTSLVALLTLDSMLPFFYVYAHSTQYAILKS